MTGNKKIVLLHGWGAEVKKLKLLADELAKQGWQTLTLKLPGFDIQPPKYIWGVEEYAKYVLEEIQKVYGKSKFFVFGHSFGGRIAIKLVEKNSKCLSGVVLCSAAGLSRSRLLKRFVFYVLAKIGKIFLLIPVLAKIWKKLLYKLAREHDYEQARGIMRDILKKVIAEDLKPIISKMKIPTLVLWGKKDQVTPISDAYYIQKTSSFAKLVVFKNEGHRLPYNKSTRVAKEIDKWAKNLN